MTQIEQCATRVAEELKKDPTILSRLDRTYAGEALKDLCAAVEAGSEKRGKKAGGAKGS